MNAEVLTPPPPPDEWFAEQAARARQSAVVDIRNLGVCYPGGAAGLKGVLSSIRRPSPARDVWALRGVDLVVRPGECLGVIGRNGAGKTTLLRVMAGLLGHDSGSVRTRGRISALLNLGVGFDPLLTGRDNVQLIGSLMGLKRSETRERMPRVIEFADIGDSIDRPLRTYSSGMRARLGFATAATMIEPHVLLLDEVMGTGDAAFRERSRDRIMELVREAHAVVVASHDMVWVTEFTNYAILLDSGAILAEGAPGGVTTLHRARAVRPPRRYGCQTCNGSSLDQHCVACGVWCRVPS